jgi:hypothetical protein
MSASVDFETKCYENDWRLVLQPGWLGEMTRRCGHTFANRRLIINNVRDAGAVRQAASAAVARGEIDTFVFVADDAPRVLYALDMSEAEFGAGYVYSIAELVGLFQSDADYLLHFSSDAYMVRHDGWIAAAIATMNDHPEVMVAIPTWNASFDAPRAQGHGMLGDFHVGYGFSDQCYLVRPAEFRAPIYRHKHGASEVYPGYGSELFEKRVDSYMRLHQRKRITHRTAWYRHKNIPARGPGRWLRSWRPFP